MIVHSAKYYPDGGRGAAFTVAHDDYTGGDVAEKMRAANREGMLIAQIETVAGVENCDAIAAVDGIDCLWVGHFDLTQSMGIPAHPTTRHSSTTSHASPRPAKPMARPPA